MRHRLFSGILIVLLGTVGACGQAPPPIVVTQVVVNEVTAVVTRQVTEQITAEPVIVTREQEITRIVEITATPSATPPASPTGRAPLPPPLLFNFSNPLQWVLDNPDAQVEDGFFVMRLHEAEDSYFTWINGEYRAGRYGLSVTQVSGGTDTAYGLAFGVNERGSQMYLFLIHSEGRYLIATCQQTCTQIRPLTTTGDWVPHPAIEPGLNMTHELVIDMAGDGTTQFVYGDELLETLKLQTFQPGGVGMFIETLGSDAATVAFDTLLHVPAYE